MCTKWPNDTVAKFPANVREINFNAMQVTEEMQGLDVEATLAWTIYRNIEDGAEGETGYPSRAYMNMGSDLKNQDPVKTTAKIKTLAQAVCRDVIANNKLDDVIKNREILITKVKSELTPMMKKWGLYLERVDIKDVKICSRSLFSDLQADFKETQKKDATIKRLTTANELKCETLKNELKDKKRYTV